jgi:hypothetical protein
MWPGNLTLLAYISPLISFSFKNKLLIGQVKITKLLDSTSKMRFINDLITLLLRISSRFLYNRSFLIFVDHDPSKRQNEPKQKTGDL